MVSYNARQAVRSMKVKSECLKRLGRHGFVKNKDSRVVKARAETSSAERVDELNELQNQKEQSRKGVLQRRRLTLGKKVSYPTVKGAW